jgi:predicted RNase H-like HicB family nuclease
MDYIDKALEKLREWIDKVIDALLGPQAQPEPEPIPIPVDDRNQRRR